MGLAVPTKNGYRQTTDRPLPRGIGVPSGISGFKSRRSVYAHNLSPPRAERRKRGGYVKSMSTTTIFSVTTILSSQVEKPEFRAICLEISYEEDWEVDFVTDSLSHAEEWCKLSTPEMLRIVKDAKRFVPRPKPRLPKGYHHKEW